MPFDLLTQEQQAELSRLSSFYLKEARRCESADAYLAGCIMAVSAFEFLLRLSIHLCPADAEKTGKIPTRNAKPEPLLRWRTIDLLRVARAAGWLPAKLDFGGGRDQPNAEVADFAEIVRTAKTLAHTPRSIQDHNGKKITSSHLKWQFEVMLSGCKLLSERSRGSMS